MRPHVAGVAIQFIHDSAQIHIVIVTEQAVFTQPLRSRPQGDVLGVALGGLYTVPVLLQGQRDEGRGVGFGGRGFVVVVLQ